MKKNFLFLTRIFLATSFVVFLTMAGSAIFFPSPKAKVNREKEEAGWRAIPVEVFQEVVEVSERQVLDKEMTVVATAYSPPLFPEGQATKSGQPVGHGIVAVDPEIICLGARVKIEGFEGEFDALDTGRLIKGGIIDIWMSSKEEALNWGRRQVKIEVTGIVKEEVKVLKPVVILKK